MTRAGFGPTWRPDRCRQPSCTRWRPMNILKFPL
jgi:hypothetical protein